MYSIVSKKPFGCGCCFNWKELWIAANIYTPFVIKLEHEVITNCEVRYFSSSVLFKIGDTVTTMLLDNDIDAEGDLTMHYRYKRWK